MVTFPYCKINLGLNIIRKRDDGYHDLVTCFYPVPWTDILEIIPSDNDVTFSASGNSIPGTVEDNLCLKAYALLKKDFDIAPVKIHLHKIIPMGAGLGGGSSDAAFTLKMLNELFELRLLPADLQRYASMLGSDCAFFIQDHPQLGTGRGEVLTDINVSLKGKFLLLVKPEVHISTAEAYRGVKPKEPSISVKEILEQEPLPRWQTLLTNDFEETIFRDHPTLADIKKTLYDRGALYASMSGSGSTLFGIFEQPVEIKFPLSLHWSCTL